jgi:type 1 fimbriae regulatory protein FimE
MTPLAYRHGLRWDMLDLAHGHLHVRTGSRTVGTSVHPLRGKELRALRRLQREQTL